MKNLIYTLAIILFFPVISHAQTYFPLPEENAYWTVLEFDFNAWEYNDIVYTVNGDTTIDNLNYKKIYRLDDFPTIYDTISTLHCFMRQNVEEKKIWFIRHYLGETVEKLGYDLSVQVGDTVNLPAFQYNEFGDSTFQLQFIDSVDLEIIGELSGYRKRYFFHTLSMNGFTIDFIEGIFELRSSFPNLEPIYGFDAFHQSSSICLQVNNSYWAGAEPYYKNCGFVVLDKEDYSPKDVLKIFPNPATDIITVQLPDTFIRPGIFIIYNHFGEPILRKEISGLYNSFAIDVTDFIHGIYFLSINSNSSTFSTKLIVNP